MSQNKLDEIRKKYQSSLQSKADELEQCWRSAESSFFSENTVATLRGRVHNLGGSAGMYGYDTVAATAKRVESQLSSGPEDSASWRKQVKEDVQQLVSLLRDEATAVS